MIRTARILRRVAREMEGTARGLFQPRKFARMLFLSKYLPKTVVCQLAWACFVLYPPGVGQGDEEWQTDFPFLTKLIRDGRLPQEALGSLTPSWGVQEEAGGKEQCWGNAIIRCFCVHTGGRGEGLSKITFKLSNNYLFGTVLKWKLDLGWWFDLFLKREIQNVSPYA